MEPDARRTRTARGTSHQKLLEAAIDLFGQRGFDGVSTREIASRAGVNISGIAYQFGGKSGLYRACISHIAETVQARLVQGALSLTPDPDQASPEDARRALHLVFSAATRFLVAAPEMDRFARIVVREQMDPTPAFEILYAGIFAPMHGRICALWSRATREPPEAMAVKLASLGVMGQLLIFRIARTAALRRLGWKSIGEKEVAWIEQHVLRTLDAALAGHVSGD
jgi:AcrR family transcriptional regulator